MILLLFIVMIQTKKFSYCLVLFFFCLSIAAQEPDTNSSSKDTAISTVSDSTIVNSNQKNAVITDSIATVIDSTAKIPLNTIVAYPPANRDWTRLSYTTGMYIGATVIAFGVLWVMPESITNWDKEEIKEKGLIWKWKENVKAGPVWDEDDWVLNWITHPYSGGIYYMTARSSGFTALESFGYSAIMSTFFWEYGVEAFAEVPSIQDLIITPVVGSAVGEGFFYPKKSILRHDKKVLKSRFLGITTLFLMDPFNTILDGFGYKEKVKTQMNVAPVGANQFTKAPIWGVSFSATF